MDDTKTTDDTKKTRRRQGGFTLIELISVIIILGILAAVIVPRYGNIAEQARTAAATGAASEGIARFNMGYALFIMRNAGAAPANMAALAPDFMNATTSLGDYAVAFVGAGGPGTTLVVNVYDNRAGTIPEGGPATGDILFTRNLAWPVP